MSTYKHSIGTENESSLHRTLKFRYTGSDGETEAHSAGFIADGISSKGEFIEVQTGSFASLKAKVHEFTSIGKVKIIHPVAITKYIEVYKPVSAVELAAEALKDRNSPARETSLQNAEPATQAESAHLEAARQGSPVTIGKPLLLHRRKSPIKGSVWNLFDALLYAPMLPLLPGLSIEIALVNIVEKRLCDDKGPWRRRGQSIIDRDLVSWHDSVILEKKSDYLRFVPFKKNEEFTSRQLAQQAGINVTLAGKALYVLAKLGIVKKTGKKGNSWLYKRK